MNHVILSELFSLCQSSFLLSLLCFLIASTKTSKCFIIFFFVYQRSAIIIIHHPVTQQLAARRSLGLAPKDAPHHAPSEEKEGGQKGSHENE